jgi:hypothetical protein
MSKREKRHEFEREDLRAQMIENAAEINRLHRRVHETFSGQSNVADPHEEWSRACREFHERYSSLCIPGGWDTGFMERLKAGEYDTVEAALCFLEVRPYFFRSGYMWKDLLRKCKRVPMNEEQASRFITLLERHSEWKANRDAKTKRGLRVRNNLSTLFLRFERLFPVYLRDSELDGIRTVGDLYGALCRELKLEPLKKPEAHDGKTRGPYSPGKFMRFPSLELHKSEAHRLSNWDAADVWATLVATIRDVYGVGEELVIGAQTVLPISRSH